MGIDSGELMNKDQARKEATLIAKQKLAQGTLYLDTETTGLGHLDEIVEISILDSDGEVLLDRLVRPTKLIPPDALAIHKITDEMVKDAPTWLEVWPEVEDLMKGRAVAIYNADYDTRIMQQSHRIYKMPWDAGVTEFLCIMLLYAQFRGEWNRSRGSYRWQSLEKAGRQARIPLQNTHRAKDDAALARAILHFIAG
jgi:DNA polymerase III epsilon subunit-like protein